MRALAGPAVALTMIVGLLAYRAAHKEVAPARDFTELELSLPGQEGSCYSLSTTFIANGVFGKTPRTWKKVDDDSWALTVEHVIQGYNGPSREFQTWTFERHGKAVELVKVEASQGLPQDPAASLDDLLSAPNSMHSTPVDRCLVTGATGYLFKRK